MGATPAPTPRATRKEPTIRRNTPAEELNTLTHQLRHLHQPLSTLGAANTLNKILRTTPLTHALLWTGRALFLVLAVFNSLILASLGQHLPAWAAVAATPLLLILWALSMWSALALWVCTGATLLVSPWPIQTWAIAAMTFSHALTAAVPNATLGLQVATVFPLLVVGAMAMLSMGPEAARKLQPLTH